MVAEEGLENRWARHRRNHEAFVAGIEAMGLEMHVKNPADRLWTLNTPRVPAGVDDAKVRAYLLEQHGMEIAGGFGPLAGKVFRIGTMGYGSTPENVMLILESLEAALQAAGIRSRRATRAPRPKSRWPRRSNSNPRSSCNSRIGGRRACTCVAPGARSRPGNRASARPGRISAGSRAAGVRWVPRLRI